MAFRVAKRIENLPNYPFVKVNAEVRKLQEQGKEIYKMNMGSPDLPPPQHVIDTLNSQSQLPNKHGYSGYRGTPAFRQAVADYYKAQFDVDLNPDTEILPLLGSKEGLVNFTLAMVSPEDVVLYPNPSYPTYEMAAILAEAERYMMPLTFENNYLPDLDAIPTDVADRAKLLWVNYPNNPTGALASVDDYARMLDFCKKHNIMLASDNPYFAIVFDGSKPTSALQVPGAKEYTVEFMSLSKSHNMAGWRLGAAVGNADAIAALLRVKSNVDSGHFTPVYDAGVAALNDTDQAWIDERNQVYVRRLQVVLDNLDDIGLELEAEPKGSIYLWPRVKGGNDEEYCRGALYEAGVSMVPGSVYGEVGKGYVRISLVQPEEKLAIAVQKLKEWYPTRG